MWKLLQLSIVFAVMSANIYFGWTSNPLAAGLWGGLIALLVTGYIVQWQNRSVRKAARLRGHERLD